jgi:hypothetical protein
MYPNIYTLVGKEKKDKRLLCLFLKRFPPSQKNSEAKEQ